MYLLIRVKSLMSLKVRSILGPPKKISKSPKLGRFSENHAKSNLLVVFRTIFLKFTQKRDLASSTSERAKRRVRKPIVVRTSEASFASERAKRSLRKSSKPSIVLTSEASFAGEQANRSLRKPAKAKQANYATNAHKAKPNKQKKTAVYATEASKPGA